jgi:hypothetical protein
MSKEDAPEYQSSIQPAQKMVWDVLIHEDDEDIVTVTSNANMLTFHLIFSPLLRIMPNNKGV